jgi:hypothetical protein
METFRNVGFVYSLFLSAFFLLFVCFRATNAQDYRSATAVLSRLLHAVPQVCKTGQWHASWFAVSMLTTDKLQAGDAFVPGSHSYDVVLSCAGFGKRCQYYFIWALSEAGINAAGFGFNGFADQEKTVAKFDRYRNADMYQVHSCSVMLQLSSLQTNDMQSSSGFKLACQPTQWQRCIAAVLCR